VSKEQNEEILPPRSKKENMFYEEPRSKLLGNLTLLKILWGSFIIFILKPGDL
jgi:hypothetical protein